MEGVENSVGAGRERVISKGPESSFEQRPKVIVEDDERRPKVIVVEDDVLLRRMVSDALRSEGSQVLEAATAYEAFLLFKSDRDVGVVISDRRVIGVLKDDALVGMLVSDYLRHCGYRVLEAENSDEALLQRHATPHLQGHPRQARRPDALLARIDPARAGAVPWEHGGAGRAVRRSRGGRRAA